MAERKISEKSLENLKRFNQENKAITRESIEISLLQLLEKKDFKKITISELVERAGVSRAAFYRNYGSKEEILKSILSLALQRLLSPWTAIISRRIFTKSGFISLRKSKKKPKSSVLPLIIILSRY